MHAGHGYLNTVVRHFDDGSHSVKHEHENGVSHKEYAVTDLDGVHDGMEDCLRCDPDKVEAELDKRGIDSEKLEDIIAPGLHEQMAGLLKEE